MRKSVRMRKRATQALIQREAAIRLSAIKDKKTGEVFEGKDHLDAYYNAYGSPSDDAWMNLDFGDTWLEGFTDHNGNFLDRDQAYKEAVRHKQYKGDGIDHYLLSENIKLNRRM